MLLTKGAFVFFSGLGLGLVVWEPMGTATSKPQPLLNTKHWSSQIFPLASMFVHFPGAPHVEEAFMEEGKPNFGAC